MLIRTHKTNELSIIFGLFCTGPTRTKKKSRAHKIDYRFFFTNKLTSIFPIDNFHAKLITTIVTELLLYVLWWSHTIWVSCNVQQMLSFNRVCRICLFYWSGRFSCLFWHSHEFVIFFFLCFICQTAEKSPLCAILQPDTTSFLLLLFFSFCTVSVVYAIGLTHGFLCASSLIIHNHNNSTMIHSATVPLNITRIAIITNQHKKNVTMSIFRYNCQMNVFFLHRNQLFRSTFVRYCWEKLLFLLIVVVVCPISLVSVQN